MCHLGQKLTVNNSCGQDGRHAGLLREELDVRVQRRRVQRLLLHHGLLLSDEAERRREPGQQGGRGGVWWRRQGSQKLFTSWDFSGHLTEQLLT